MKASLLCCLLLSLVAANPGLQAALELSDVNQILMIGYAFGLAGKSFSLGSYSVNMPSPLGQLTAELEDITLEQVSLDFADSVLSFQSPDVITYNLLDLSIEGTMEYNITVGDFPLTPGPANFSLSSTNATVSFIVSATSNGNPQLTFTNFDLELGTVLLNTSLPADFNQIINELLGEEVGNLTKQLPAMLGQYVPTVNQMLAGLDLKIAIPNTDVAIDLGLESDPQIINDSQLVIGLCGTVYDNGAPVPAGTPVVVPSQYALSEGVQFGVTDAFVNALLTPLWPLFSYTISTSFLETDLTTDVFEEYLPELLETFGKGLPVKLDIRSGGPISYRTDGDLYVDAHLLMDVSVKTGLFHWTLGATFAVKVDTAIAASVHNNVASADIKSCKLASISVVHSFIGTITVKMLEPLIELVLKIVLGKVNDKMRDIAIPLPDGIGNFIQTDDVLIGNGYILAGLEL